MSEHSEFWHDSSISGDFKRDWAKGPLSSSWFMITYLSFQKSLSITSQSQKIPNWEGMDLRTLINKPGELNDR